MNRRLLDERELAAHVARLVAEIAAQGPVDAIIGIRRRGVPLAARLARALAGRGRPEPPLGELDITLYRDDVDLKARQPVVHATRIEFPIDETRLLLVDDVLYSGRTIRAALSALGDLGRPRRIELAVLVDRGHRELPIQADYVGLRVDTTLAEEVVVRLIEIDGEDAVDVLSP